MIYIDIDMPKNCFACDKTYKWRKDGKVQCPHINMPSISSNTTNRPCYCPLKEIHTGHWIEHKEGYTDCSNCGYVAQKIEFADTCILIKSNYCPNCGARMGSEDK